MISVRVQRIEDGNGPWSYQSSGGSYEEPVLAAKKMAGCATGHDVLEV